MVRTSGRVQVGQNGCNLKRFKWREHLHVYLLHNDRIWLTGCTNVQSFLPSATNMGVISIGCTDVQAFLAGLGTLNAFSAAILLAAAPSLDTLFTMGPAQQQALQRQIVPQVRTMQDCAWHVVAAMHI